MTGIKYLELKLRLSDLYSNVTNICVLVSIDLCQQLKALVVRPYRF
jgi:hypothetical protein